MVNFDNKKRVFWEALILTIAIFIIGFMIGIYFEDKRVEIIQDYYIQSENSLIDIFALNNLVNTYNFTCADLFNTNLNFADRIYDEARILEKYEESGRLKGNLKPQHRKYDIMRTMVWINSFNIRENCPNLKANTVVYLYRNYNEDLGEKANNNVWSKILINLKSKHGDTILLIPIAVDTEVSSLDLMLKDFEISKYPVLIINNKYLVDELSSVEEIEKYLS